MDIRKDLLVREDAWLLRAPGNPRARLDALSKIRAPGLSNPSKPTEKEPTSAKNWKILMRRNSGAPGLCRDKAEASSLGRSFRARESSQQFPYFSEKTSPHLAYRASTNPAKFAPSFGPTVSHWFCPSRPYCGMNSAHSWHTVLVRKHVSRSNGMRCFTSDSVDEHPSMAPRPSRQSQNPPFQESSAIPTLPWPSKSFVGLPTQIANDKGRSH
jgi:hypothetical protein